MRETVVFVRAGGGSVVKEDVDSRASDRLMLGGSVTGEGVLKIDQ